mmetsp:Transcript_1264/g.2740  ORF Transcript_1264/g.2740 Transcript_1264/m.2740 type:complete len:219 (+) Transcript_1264:1484-2140(+)
MASRSLFFARQPGLPHFRLRRIPRHVRRQQLLLVAPEASQGAGGLSNRPHAAPDARPRVCGRQLPAGGPLGCSLRDEDGDLSRRGRASWEHVVGLGHEARGGLRRGSGAVVRYRHGGHAGELCRSLWTLLLSHAPTEGGDAAQACSQEPGGDGCLCCALYVCQEGSRYTLVPAPGGSTAKAGGLGWAGLSVNRTGNAEATTADTQITPGLDVKVLYVT